ncbi:hypothetical protein K435DRAFT_869436 [Dendrothele bispora CBS 962.96]|uniref:Uncharacterized protein n=1 Tax=Dendrothele bispora (strain CBS 962.96) TaxID=1314807 RepID=A0A4V6T544_DENBC|nr:hypothetical protein K435DRAFT_869436 [Dendrothele bispora CBS 962.96]
MHIPSVIPTPTEPDSNTELQAGPVSTNDKANLTVTASAGGKTRKSKPKKDELMVASDAKSDRNLFLIDYLQAGNTPTKAEFKKIWDELDAQTKTKYKSLSKAKSAEVKAKKKSVTEKPEDLSK